MKLKNRRLPITLLLMASITILGLAALRPLTPEAAAGPAAPCPPGAATQGGGALWVAWAILPGGLPPGNTVDYVCFQNNAGVGAGCVGAGGCISNTANVIPLPVQIGNPNICPAPTVNAGAGAGNGLVSVDFGVDCAKTPDTVTAVFHCVAAGAGACRAGPITVTFTFSPTPPPNNLVTAPATLEPCTGTTSDTCYGPGIGGTIVPTDKIALVTPIIGFASVVAAAIVVSAVYLRRVKAKNISKE